MMNAINAELFYFSFSKLVAGRLPTFVSRLGFDTKERTRRFSNVVPWRVGDYEYR